MSDIKTFATRKDAKAEVEKMRGWDAKVSQIYQPEDENANKNGNVFVIQVKRRTGDPMYMRNDWYVR